MPVELPRLTKSLRTFSDLEKKERLDLEPNDLIRRRKEQATRLKSIVNWNEFRKRIPESALPLLSEIYQIAATNFEGQSSDAINEFVMFTLRLLIDEKHVTHKNYGILKELAGHLTIQDVNKIFKIITTMRAKFDEETLILLIDPGDNTENNASSGMDIIFGLKVPYKPTKIIWPDTGQLREMFAVKRNKEFDNFSMIYRSEPKPKEKAEFDKKTFLKNLKECYDSHCSEKYSYDFFFSTLIDNLKYSEDLQGDLLDLLGFNELELIEYIIQYQQTIVALFNTDKSKQTSNLDRPTISSQVIVQSEHEKQLMKQVRKEGKKLQKISGRFDNKSEQTKNGYDHVPLQLKKQEALNASRAPIFPIRSTIPPERYPYVFDTINTSKQSSGHYVSGKQLMLPESTVRKDSPLCEEVYIPASQMDSIEIGYERVEISSLDEIGQMAFKGTESLNRIQSIVFHAAYHTNENLLICAPTGAGKTNVAMLTILHQLKQHMTQDELTKDVFKIVYIAPMKALAAEMTSNFSKRLGSLGITVRELTGDTQLTKSEIQKTQMIVTTPEKWDIVTRKGTGDVSLSNIVKLLIIDEVHLLHGDRGPVVESLVARTLRQVESSQRMIRIVGLSATLPNYVDVARFLRVNPYKGLFYFDHRFRPVPLNQTFIGVKAVKPLQQINDMDLVCYEKVVNMVRQGHQVMVFVHARNATAKTANVIRDLAIKNDTLKLFVPNDQFKAAGKILAKSQNRLIQDLYSSGISIHHAGMLRSDRNIVEKSFNDGLIKVLVCTATLAWGVNLPAHAVIIRGTEIYDAKHGSFVDLGILDVLQIFGRAGRPQFDTSGDATIITSHNKLNHYLSLLTNQIPIESSFLTFLADNLNAEIALGTISNVTEAVEWLSYTYLFVRMRLNGLVYGISHQTLMDDPNLERKRKEFIDIAAKALDKAQMIRYNIKTGDLSTTDLGRIASHFYLKYDTVERFNASMKPLMTETDILTMISNAQEFEQLKVRDDELDELDQLIRENCELKATGGPENVHGKVNILLQTYISRGKVRSFSLISDSGYISQNATRICRAVFEIMLRKNNAIMASRLLELAKMLELQQWDFMSPLRQFTCIPMDVISKIEAGEFTVYKLKEMDVKEIGILLRNQKTAHLVKRCCDELPILDMQASLQPITRTVLRIRLKVFAQFHWNDRIHGTSSQAFWIWIEDPESNFIYHHEHFLATKKMVCTGMEQELVMTIPLTEPLPTQYIVKVTSDHWLGCENTLPLTFQHLILPENHPPHTDLLELQPVPVQALGDSSFVKLYDFTHFNPIQTQIFHCLYHTDNNVLLGAPTGSGKTIAAEIAMFRMFREYPNEKVVYIAPLKALVRERIKDWKIRLEERLGKNVVELTGDVTPDMKAISKASVIVTTPEKWDGISRSWQTRNYVKMVGLIIIDEIHLLGEDRGPVLEVIVSRTNFIASHTLKKLRIIGLSTALANAVDLAGWLGITDMGLYNFRPSVRPVPLEVHINGFPGKHYCPRMATMNRPAFQAIKQHAPSSPSLIFVSSRRQTRLTALDLIGYLAVEDNPKQWLNMNEDEMDNIISGIKDSNLKLTLSFGIGIHHAGLQDKDRCTVEELFVNRKIQVLVATATLAWGVNFPAHLVIIKGTEYYDAKTKRYVDMPITDILQMMGRAGRPKFDDSGVAVVFVHDLKKNFYKKFLYEPFPVESSLLNVLPDHVNAEIVAGTIKTNQEFLDYLTWTYFFRRLMKNPIYYDLESLEPTFINWYLSELVKSTVQVLVESHCIAHDEIENVLYPLPMGRIASFYYLSHRTMSMFEQSLKDNLTWEQYLRILCNSHEYNELPVRHNEELLNEELSKNCRYPVDYGSYDSPNTKAFLLLQAHFSRLAMPCADYITDLKSVLDQSIRIIQAMIDVVAEQGWLVATLKIIQLLQMILQSRWFDESAITTLPFIEKEHLYLFNNLSTIIPDLCYKTCRDYHILMKPLAKEFLEDQIVAMHQVLKQMPMIRIDLALEGSEMMKNIPLNSKLMIDVCANKDYTLVIGLKRNNHSSNLKAHCPMYHKSKDEGWFLILGNYSTEELLALKRVTGINHLCKKQQLQFTAPQALGSIELILYFFSDCYLGLNQQYSIHLNVVDKI